MKTLPIIEQHIHGAFGVDFNKADVNDILDFSKKIREFGVAGFFPTLVTDSVENIKRQIDVIKQASKKCHGILGIHLEGIFINPVKKGIHNSEHFLALTEENYKKLEDDFIKIVTLAPELDNGLIDYLNKKGVKIQAGHCVGWDDKDRLCAATHTFNAMGEVSHKKKSTALEALLDDKIYAEVIADGVHVIDDALKLLFKSKPQDKIILVSDALPITYSNLKECVFADSKIYYDGNKASSSDGTLAGSTKLIKDIVQVLGKKGLFKPQYLENIYKYHNIEPKGELIWDEEFNLKEIKLD